MAAKNNELKKLFDLFRKEMKDVNSAADLNADIISALWSVSILASIEHMAMQMPDADESELIELSRMNALKHFDLALLDTYGVSVDEDE